jgi:hypothetical protein
MKIGGQEVLWLFEGVFVMSMLISHHDQNLNFWDFFLNLAQSADPF